MALDRLDAVRIRIGIDEAQIQSAVDRLGLASVHASPSKLYLLDHRDAGHSLEPSGVTISFRISDDAHLRGLTVHVRRVLRTRLGVRWSCFTEQDGDRFTIEEERDSTRRVLTASLRCAAADPATVLAHEAVAWPDVLSGWQKVFLDDCAPMRLGDWPLAVLGPINASSWTLPLKFTRAIAQRWTYRDVQGGAFDALELTCRSTPLEAGFVHPVLASILRRAGIDADGGAPWLETRAAGFWRTRG